MSRTSLPLVSCLIPFHPRAQSLRDQLQALAAQIACPPCEFIFCSAGPAEHAKALIESWRERLPGVVRVIECPVPTLSAAKNCAAAHARGPLLACLGAEDRAATDWLASLVAETSRHADADLILGSLYAWAGGPGAVLAPAHFSSASSHAFWLHASARNWLLRAPVLHALGGWDENLAEGEDADLAWRAQRAGFLVVAAPTARETRGRGGASRLSSTVFAVGRGWGALTAATRSSPPSAPATPRRLSSLPSHL
jgi:glycosyltransferase involved in cell wall biosynthesis